MTFYDDDDDDDVDFSTLLDEDGNVSKEALKYLLEDYTGETLMEALRNGEFEEEEEEK